MELLKNVASLQSAQAEQPTNAQVQTKQTEPVEQIRNDVQANNQEVKENSKIISQKDVEDLVKDLNNSLGPLNTSIRFGFDNKSEDFFVSVIEANTNKLIRRFPAEHAYDILPKIQDVSGLLFDSKG